MELLDRYLRSLQFWLPGDQRHDIIAEITEDIRSQVEEKQATLGRELNADEMRALLKGRGSPVRVAESYLPQRYLIGRSSGCVLPRRCPPTTPTVQLCSCCARSLRSGRWGCTPSLA